MQGLNSFHLDQRLPSVVHVITGLNVGGAERALFTLLTGGLEGPFRNHVISLMEEGHYGPLLREAGVGVTCLNMRSRRPDLAAVLRLRQILRRQAPQIIQGWMYHGNIAATFGAAGMCLAPKLVWNVRSSLDAFDEHGGLTRGLINLGSWISRRPTAIIYNCERSRAQHEAVGYAKSKGRVIPNGFDTALWSPDGGDRVRVRATLGVNQDGFLLGFVGRHHPHKDLRNLLIALAPVMAAQSAVHAVFIGRGIDQQAADLAPLFGKLPSDRVHLHGERDDVPTLMRGLDLLCLPSRTEGFPNVVGEAMATEVPCVVTDVGDAAFIVGDAGWVVPPRDSKALAEAINEAVILSAPSRHRRGAAARARILRDYSLGSVVELYRGLYNQITVR